MVWEEIEAEENLDGLSDEQKATFRERALPVPGAMLREPYTFTNDARRDIPSTIIATGFSAADYQKYAAGGSAVVSRRDPGAAQPLLCRPADEPLADVVEADRARADHRRHRHEGGRGPMTTTLVDDAMAHHIWATQRLIDACADLTPEQLRTPAPGTFGPIIDTLRHIVSTDGWYLTFFRDWTNAIDEEDQSVTLRRPSCGHHDERRGLDRDPGRGSGWRGRTWSSTATAGTSIRPSRFRLAQVFHHGTDHRSQVCTALTSLGIEPPEIDLWAWGEATGRTRGETLTAAT